MDRYPRSVDDFDTTTPNVARIYVVNNTFWTDWTNPDGTGVSGGGWYFSGGTQAQYFWLRNNIFATTQYAFAYPGKKTIVESLRESNWAVFILGLAAASIELGFLLAYRASWRISLAAVATNVTVTILLVPIGVMIFKDHLSLRNILGLVFCILGLVLVVRD